MGPGKVNESVLRIDHLLVPGRDLYCVHDLVDDCYFCGRLVIVVDSSSPWLVSVVIVAAHTCSVVASLYFGARPIRRESCEVVFYIFCGRK